MALVRAVLTFALLPFGKMKHRIGMGGFSKGLAVTWKWYNVWRDSSCTFNFLSPRRGSIERILFSSTCALISTFTEFTICTFTDDFCPFWPFRFKVQRSVLRKCHYNHHKISFCDNSPRKYQMGLIGWVMDVRYSGQCQCNLHLPQIFIRYPRTVDQVRCICATCSSDAYRPNGTYTCRQVHKMVPVIRRGECDEDNYYT